MDKKRRSSILMVALGIMALSLVIVLIIALNSSSPSSYVESTAQSSTLDTPIGRFVGKVSAFTSNDKKYISYKSIPFGVPPVGELRFTRPQPFPEKQPGQLVNSLVSKPSCWAVNKVSTDPRYGEDCLYLNVFAPYRKPQDVAFGQEFKLPVMIWLHGGGFVGGSAHHKPAKLVTRGQVIVVMVNYRMGVFGFLTTGNDTLPSNNGLWDQHLAIKWVSENILHFNGDPSRITVFGMSAGAISTGLLALSPVSSKYFQKVVLQSGAATSLISRDARQRAFDFGTLVGCDVKDGFASCLRNVSVADILANSKPDSFELSESQKQLDFIWMPVIDGEIIPDEPMLLMANDTYLEQLGAYEKDYLIGILDNDGALVMNNFLNPLSYEELVQPSFFTNLSQYLLLNRYGINASSSYDLQQTINRFYTGSAVLLNDTVSYNKVLDLVSDMMYLVPAMETALAMTGNSGADIDHGSSCLQSTSAPATSQASTSSKMSKTYFYFFDYCPEKDACQPQCMAHGDDFYFEFPKTKMADSIQENLSNIFVDLLTTFARTSDPGRIIDCGWPEFNYDTQKYLRIGPNPTVRSFLNEYRSTFWLRTFLEELSKQL